MNDLNKLMNRYEHDIELQGALQELKQRKESEIRSATKYLSNSQFKQLCHITSELFEVFVAWIVCKISPTDSNFGILLNELIDLQSSCQTMLEGPLGISKSALYIHRLMVVEKNDRRKYYSQSY